MLIFGELSCWTVFGIHKPDPRLITLGFTGVTASVLMLARIHRAQIARGLPIRRPSECVSVSSPKDGKPPSR
jgi:hypothetical protein